MTAQQLEFNAKEFAKSLGFPKGHTADLIISAVKYGFDLGLNNVQDMLRTQRFTDK